MSRIEKFEMDIASLNRQRTVWVYLPSDYDICNKHYPVIYMHDGQNLFYDNLTAYGTAWHVDKSLDKIFDQTGHSAIVVGVECDGKYRLSEYSPWKVFPLAFRMRYTLAHGTNKGGEGEKYADFFVNVLKPYVDSHYKTDASREATAVVGSSMGGLISCYLGLSRQQTYGTMGLFSTFTPFNLTAFNRFLQKTPQTTRQNAIVYCGGKEGLDTTTDGFMQRCSVNLYKKLSKRGVATELWLDSELSHSESSWDVYFEKFASDFLERYYQSEN